MPSLSGKPSTLSRSGTSAMAPKKRRKPVLGDFCVFCKRGGSNIKEAEVFLGENHMHNNKLVHEFCLLFSAALMQKGDDTEGIIGFLPEDIDLELKRGKSLRCTYCNEKEATIGCSVSSCRNSYHYPCGFEHGAQFVFSGRFPSYCVNHRKHQECPKIAEPVDCLICYNDILPGEPENFSIFAPCCGKLSWFHHICLQKMANSAGYFFCCPICKNKEEFLEEMQKFGIHCPQKDAVWEVEGHFNDLLVRPDRCSVVPCKCPNGVTHDQADTSWDLLPCVLCGSESAHKECGKDGVRVTSGENDEEFLEWHCPACLELKTQKDEAKKEEKPAIVQFFRRMGPEIPSQQVLSVWAETPQGKHLMETCSLTKEMLSVDVTLKEVKLPDKVKNTAALKSLAGILRLFN